MSHEAPAVVKVEAAPTDLSADFPGAGLSAAAIAAVLHLLTVVGRALMPFLPVPPLLSIVFLVVSLLAFYRHRWIRLYRPYGSRTPIYLAELIVLIVLTRLVPLLATPAQLLNLAPRWLADPTTLLDPFFVLGLVMVLGAWGLGHTIGAAIDKLHLQYGEALPDPAAPEYDQWERIRAGFDHRGGYQTISNLAFFGSLVTIVALAPLLMSSAQPALIVEGLVTAGIYVVSTLLLLAWAHVTLLDTLWRGDGLATPEALRQRWAAWLVPILALVALLALLAPRAYGLDPIALLVLIMHAVVTAFQVMLFLLMLPFMWLAGLLGLGAGGSSGGLVPPVLPPAVERNEFDGAWLELLRSLGFWLLAVALVVYSLRTLYQSRWGAMRWLPRLPFWRRLVGLWRSLWSGLAAQATHLSNVLNARRLREAAALMRRTPTPRPTDSRGWIQFLYLSLVERAGRRGLPRRRGMTAAEYSRYLAGRLTTDPTSAGSDPAAARADLDSLTAAFLAARYSQHPVGDADVGLARRALQRILSLIRRAAVRR